MRYKIVKSESDPVIESFEAKIEKLMEEGWTLVGGAQPYQAFYSLSGDPKGVEYVQTLTRPSDDKHLLRG